MEVEKDLLKIRLDLLNLAKEIKNVSEACRIMGISRQHYYSLFKAYQEKGLRD
ncbi:MAG: helix-turn-helix domain-containing protein [Nitrospirae bacterium]|nr:helix-turn-helix domain-containing protein [Nitrospirota bacterium]MBI3351351.1 helix-turn-helix domain-containing protein [Nitrospirota bacterium]